MEDLQTATKAPQFAFKKRNTKSKSTIRKRPATPRSDSDFDSGFSSFEDEEGQRQVKRRCKSTAAITASSAENPKSRQIPDKQTSVTAVVALTNKDDATKQSNWYDADVGNEKSDKSSTAKRTDIERPDGKYKGVANYQSFIQKNPDRAPKQVGPVNSSTNVRTITVTDFAPDVCKDYKQTVSSHSLRKTVTSSKELLSLFCSLLWIRQQANRGS